MSNCCAASAASIAGVTSCPVSGAGGKPVELQTVKALLTSEALQRLNISSHRFCPDPACDVVYFDEGGRTYSKADVRVPVWQKEPFGDRIVCYCFGENEADIRTEIQTSGNSNAVERVRAHIEAGRCACEVRNPRGVCCLGDVAAAVTRVAAAAGAVRLSAVARSIHASFGETRRSLGEGAKPDTTVEKITDTVIGSVRL